VRTLESLSSSRAPCRTLRFVTSFVARALLSARGSLSNSRAAWRTLRLVSSFEAIVILPKRRASFRLCGDRSHFIPLFIPLLCGTDEPATAPAKAG
jgi:hypothetical protein